MGIALIILMSIVLWTADNQFPHDSVSLLQPPKPTATKLAENKGLAQTRSFTANHELFLQ